MCKKNEAEISLESGYWVYKIGEKSWIFDTAATFGSTEMQCASEKDEVSIMSIGGVFKSNSCKYRIGHISNYPLLFNSNENVLGHNFFSTFGIVKRKTLGEYQKSKLIFNGNFLILAGEVSLGSTNVKNANICIDTGASKTFFLPRIYKKFRGQLQQKPIFKFAAQTPYGKVSTFSKIIVQTTIKIDKLQYNLAEVPIIIKNFGINECDLILGMDVLKNLRYIDYENLQIALSESS